MYKGRVVFVARNEMESFTGSKMDIASFSSLSLPLIEMESLSYFFKTAKNLMSIVGKKVNFSGASIQKKNGMG